MKGPLLPLVLLVACGRAPPPAATQTAVDSLLGTWRVIRFTARATRDTTATFPFGLDPHGYLVYDGTGHVFFQAFRPTAMDSLARARGHRAPDAVMIQLRDGFIAHFGTYTVDPTQRTVTHHIEGEMPLHGGTFEVATPFRLEGDTLVLGSDRLRSWAFLRVR